MSKWSKWYKWATIICWTNFCRCEVNTKMENIPKYFGFKGKRPLKEVLLLVFYRHMLGALSRFSDGQEQSPPAELHRANLTAKSNRIREVRRRCVLTCLMTHFRYRRRARVQTWIPNSMATLHCAKHVHIAQTRTRIPTPYFCTGRESESVSLSECVSSNVNERLGPFTRAIKLYCHARDCEFFCGMNRNHNWNSSILVSLNLQILHRGPYWSIQAAHCPVRSGVSKCSVDSTSSYR